MNFSWIFAEIAASIPARCGRLFEQYFRPGPPPTDRPADGAVLRAHAVRQRQILSRSASRPRTRPAWEEIERGARLAALFEKIWEMAERARGRPATLKKNGREPRR